MVNKIGVFSMLENKTIVVGVTGGIAAYKAAEIVSRLKKMGADVYCVMTEGAQAFLTPLTLRTLSGNPVITSMFQEPVKWNVEHIALADYADIFLIAPATANIIGKIANGIADDFLTTTIMATKAKVVFAPAMNVNMYNNPVFQENVSKLKKLGYYFIEPVEGNLACGYAGKGKMAEPENIVQYLSKFEKDDLKGVNILITAGPTREPIDPVRYITNRSTGKMGYALARCAQQRGANVTLISGPTNLDKPQNIEFIQVQTAREMFNEVTKHLEKQNVIIKSAAVADYRPQNYNNYKIKKTDEDLQINLERNPDILGYLGKNKGNRILVGFAAETNDLKENAQKKVNKKNLDFIVANDVTQKGAGFGCDTNKVTLFYADGSQKDLPLLSKNEVANLILDEVSMLLKRSD
ncbi:MAG: phosphopantothenoylcysteine decarboxylase / phosphopantothenate---cysteine ligase [Clostridia bacterium]|jgi:phosphopantothenoylcysteine decarboxylase/phosphopantothenate--cysteine ligase|nr:phosphopantothenoylcysteine decarboxylase / phosphopantothenate---cysteine ligase [Clostridia bacterium]MDN5322258.1 phosphopantothenoylcysteine decarboxylase / phosphopantothenate---cysteine ligase [Clostridia bacterium]